MIREPILWALFIYEAPNYTTTINDMFGSLTCITIIGLLWINHIHKIAMTFPPIFYRKENRFSNLLEKTSITKAAFLLISWHCKWSGAAKGRDIVCYRICFFKRLWHHLWGIVLLRKIYAVLSLWLWLFRKRPKYIYVKDSVFRHTNITTIQLSTFDLHYLYWTYKANRVHWDGEMY